MTSSEIATILGIIASGLTISGTIWATWKTTLKEQKQQTEALAMAIEKVIEKAVMKEQRHESHERRLDKLEQQHKETMLMLEKNFDKIDRQLDQLVYHIINEKG